MDEYIDDGLPDSYAQRAALVADLADRLPAKERVIYVRRAVEALLATFEPRRPAPVDGGSVVQLRRPA